MAHVSESKVEGVVYTYDSESRNPLGLDAKMKMWAGTLVYDKNTRAPTRILKDVEAPAPGPVAQKPKTPTISFSVASQAGTSTVVTLACATAGAEIYYTTNGSAPSKSSNAYTAPFELTADATIKAIAYFDFEDGNGERASSVASAQWKKKVEVTPPPSNDFTYHYGKALYNRTVVNGGFEGLEADDLAAHILNDPTNHFTGTASTTARLEVTPPAKVTNDVFSGLAQNYIAIPEGKVPTAIKNITVNANGLMSDTDAAKVIIEKNTKGAQIPMYMKTVSLNGENYVVFFGWGDTTATCVFNPNSL